MTPEERLEKLKKLQRLKELKALKAQRDAANQGGDSTPTTSPETQQEPSQLESGLRGLGQGATFNTSDEIIGGARSIWDDMKAAFGSEPMTESTYEQYRDEERAKNRAAQEANPFTYGTGEFAGGMVTSLIPGAGLAKGAGLASRIGRAGLEAAAFGAGASEANTTKGVAEDALDSAMLGGGIAAGLGGLGKIGSSIANSKYAQAFKGGANVGKFTDSNAQRDLANQVSEAINDRVSQARQAHGQARGQFVKELGQETVDASDVASNVRNNIDRYGPDATTEIGTFGALSPKEAQDVERYVSALETPRTAQELYKIWDDIGQRVNYYNNTLKSGNTEINRQLQALRSGIKEKLHSLSPELAQADATMGQTANAAKHLSRGADDTSAESFLSTLGNKNRGNRKAAFDQLLGDDVALQKELQDFDTFKAFEGQGGAGSSHGLRNIGGIGAGSALGSVFGPVGAAAGAAAGAAVANPQLQRKILTEAGDKLQPILNKIPSLPPKYSGPLQEAVRKGGNAVAVTHFMLSQTDPEYNQMMTKKDEN